MVYLEGGKHVAICSNRDSSYFFAFSFFCCCCTSRRENVYHTFPLWLSPSLFFLLFQSYCLLQVLLLWTSMESGLQLQHPLHDCKISLPFLSSDFSMTLHSLSLSLLFHHNHCPLQSNIYPSFQNTHAMPPLSRSPFQSHLQDTLILQGL